ncbi:snRNA-activating protein complex subunit 1 isoform X2 [Ornithorhynchus anatinus]|uniref:Small nuclear RNA activating complex polypeptide 1 n=1 Tax=Ornithorhynchus anatinus TaxID=9258 RepID=F7G7A5_ORNAN|nr:snRNA-activating protein complex subunit 1 isoform X2 [Ornithorhynchus anatinus]
MAPTPGLQADCEALLRRFQDKDSVRFEDFAAIWRDLKFGTIFHGKMGHLEMSNFTREAFALSWRYFLPPFTFQIRVGALYLLYGLFFSQRCQPKQQIRIALKDWDEVMQFQQDLTNAQHYDAAYVLRKLRLEKAFHFTAMPKPLSYRIKRKMPSTEFKEEFKEPQDRVTKLITSDVLEEMLNVHDHYQKMKCAISAEKSKPDRALDLIKNDFVGDVRSVVLEHQQWLQDRKKSASATRGSVDVTDETEGSSQESEGSERAKALAKIKSKSYSAVAQASKSRRHRQVRLESSDSVLDKKTKKQLKDTGNTKSLKSAGKRSSRAKGGPQPMKQESAPAYLSMPVIAEEEEEGSQSSDAEFPTPKRTSTC